MDESKMRYTFEISNAPKLDPRSEVIETSRMFGELAKTASETMKKISEANILMFKSIFDALASLNDIDWEEADQSYKEAAISLGQKGWTIPMNMATNDIIKLAEIQDQNELDLIFQKFYEIEENYVYIKSTILNHNLASKWKDLLTQCFNSYEQDNFLIVIPNLFLVFEGVAQELIAPKYKKFTDSNGSVSLRGKYKRVKKEIEPNRTYSIYYSSITEFINTVFKFGEFDRRTSRFEIINRNWVLHGHDNPHNWEKADALRLFNAIDTIIQLDFLLEDIEIDEANEELIK